MPAAKEPKIKEITVHWGGGGKVALEEFGKQSSEYGCNISRNYVIPSDWDETQIAIFELETIQSIKDQLEPILHEEHEHRMRVRDELAS